MTKTKIDWCDATWNPVVGCNNNCPYCYARRMANRFHRDFQPHWVEKNFNRAMPRRPSRIFVDSMSDVAFWKPEWWDKVIGRICKNSQHQFLFLTKYPAIYHRQPLPENCWLGATATTVYELGACQDSLLYLPNPCFISIEPILEEIGNPANLDRHFIKWVILGAETGNRRGKVIPQREWIEPFLSLPIPLYMKKNLPWSGPWRKEFPA